LAFDLIVYSATSCAKDDDLFSNNLVGESYSITSPATCMIADNKENWASTWVLGNVTSLTFQYAPWLRSKTMSLSRTEVIRCAMVITVQSEKCCLRVCWIRLSVDVSTEAVASSRTNTLLFLSSTRPRQTSCLWPILQFSPFSLTTTSDDHLQCK
jgi:hypothetical protein